MEDKTQNEKNLWAGVEPTGRLLRPAEVIERTGLSKSQIYQMISSGAFPPFIKLSARASAMPESWLCEFVKKQAEATLREQGRKRVLPSDRTARLTA